MKKLKLIFSIFCAILFIANVIAQDGEVVQGGSPDHTPLIAEPTPDDNSTIIDTSETEEIEAPSMDD